MKSLLLLRSQDFFSLDIRKSLFVLALIFYFVYLAFGNLLRLIQIPILTDNLAFSELVLYSFCFLCLFFLKVERRRGLHIAVLSLAIMGSSFYGAWMNGLDLKASFHAVRLVCVLFSSLVLAEIFFVIFKERITELFQFLLTAYGVSLLLGSAIYIFFPVSEKLWDFLERYNIIFHGDPHQGRFISVYFDPNFYSNISFLPLFLSLSVFQKTKKSRYLVMASLFLLSGVLAWSRSGLFVLTFLLSVFFLRKTKFLQFVFIKKSVFYGLLVFAVAFFAVAIVCREELFFFLNRSLNLSGDESALARLASFQYGFTFIVEHPLLGIGYNYLTLHSWDLFNWTAIDSSLLFTALSFGCVPLLLFSFYMVTVFVNMKVSFCKIKNIDPVIYSFLFYFVVYLFVIIFFSSFFVNILYYPLWQIPVLSLGFYLTKACREISLHSAIKPID